MTPSDIITVAGLVAPGFLAMKLFYTFGAQRQRAQWEWIVWSALIGLPADALARWVTGTFTHPADWPDWPVDGAVRLLLPCGLALLFAWVWRERVKPAEEGWLRFLRRGLTDSAWDEVMDDAVQHERWVEIVTETSSGEVSYTGWLSTVGREDSAAERWVYIEKVQHRPGDGAELVPLVATHGLLIHRDHIKRIRIFDLMGAKAEPPITAGIAATVEASE
jgi:hypothetical protein